MGITNTLVLVAVVTGLAPMASLRFRSPDRLLDHLIAFGAGLATLLASMYIVGRVYPFRLFEYMHLGYLLVVVSAPIAFGLWFVLAARVRRWTLGTAFAGVIALVAAGAGIWGTHIEPDLLRVDRAQLASSLTEPISIGVISDVQTPNVGDIEWDAINALIAESPDMVVVPGDLYQGSWLTVNENAPDFTALLTELVDNVEVVAVVSGDSDRSGQLPSIVEAAGALFIDNTILDIEVAGQPVRLAGIEVFPSQARRDTIAALGTPSDALTILVSHRPGIVYSLPPNSDVDVIFAGHTHGGQIRLPFVSDHIWYSDVPPSVSAGGLHELRGFQLYVSTGVGMERHASPQVRFGVRPEVGIVTVG